MNLVDVLLCAVMVIAGISAMSMRNILSAVVLVGGVSLLASFLFLRMSAPDVAMTEASIGAALTTVIFIIAVRRTKEKDQ